MGCDTGGRRGKKFVVGGGHVIMTSGIEDTRKTTSAQSHLTHPSPPTQSATPPHYCADRHRTIQKKKKED
jgi:hypothetical protein